MILIIFSFLLPLFPTYLLFRKAAKTQDLIYLFRALILLPLGICIGIPLAIAMGLMAASF